MSNPIGRVEFQHCLSLGCGIHGNCDAISNITLISSVSIQEPTESIEDLRKRLAVLGGELRKSDTSKKTFEVATERLLQFAEVKTAPLSSYPCFYPGFFVDLCKF